MSDTLDVEVWGVKKTGRSVDGVDVLEVSLMVQAAAKQSSELKAWVYPEDVELKSDPSKLGLHHNDVEEVMTQAAMEWDESLGEFETELIDRRAEAEADSE